MKDVSGKVLEGLEKIPMILDSARRFLRLFGEAEALRARSSELYAAVLEALGHILEYLRQRTASKRFLRATAAFFQQQSWEADLTSKIDKIADARDEFNLEADVCHKEADSAGHRGTVEEIRKLDVRLEEARKENQRVQAVIEEVNLRLGKLQPYMNELIVLLTANPELKKVAIQLCE